MVVKEEVKWETLEQNGVIFPPPYQPHGVEMLENGNPFVLTPGEECIGIVFVVMKDTNYAKKPKFLDILWHDWNQVLGLTMSLKSLSSVILPQFANEILEKKRRRNK